MSQPLGLIQDQFGNVTAVAAWVLLGRTAVHRVLARFILGGDYKSCPARYFSSEAEAGNWLQEYTYVH